MTKSDFNLIHAFIDTKNLKKELNYAYFGEDGIYATDTRIAIHFSAPMLGLDVLLHKKILKGFIGSIDSDASVSVDGFGFLKSDCGVKMSCDTYNYDDPKVPDFKIMFDVQFEYRMTLEDISDLHFELSQRECFIDDNRLYPIIEFGGCDKYEVFFNKQKI